MTRNTITTLAIGSGLVLALVMAPAVQAGPDTPAPGMPMTSAQMKDHCAGMMEHKKTMAADMKAQDAALAELVGKMNRAQGAEQISLMAAVITQMVDQRTARGMHKVKMDDEMMAHMMQHMQTGKDSMSQCPMMKDMKDMKGMAGMRGMGGKSTDAN
jgi:hypothetical protein